jgi:hypothetical protein
MPRYAQSDLESRCPGLCRILGAGGRLGGNASSRSLGAGCLDLVRIRNNSRYTG